MTGPEHFAEAERLIFEANEIGHHDPERGRGILAAAQVHATLADAAATALNDHAGGSPIPEWHHWRVAAGYPADADGWHVAAFDAGQLAGRAEGTQ